MTTLKNNSNNPCISSQPLGEHAGFCELSHNICWNLRPCLSNQGHFTTSTKLRSPGFHNSIFIENSSGESLKARMCIHAYLAFCNLWVVQGEGWKEYIWAVNCGIVCLLLDARTSLFRDQKAAHGGRVIRGSIIKCFPAPKQVPGWAKAFDHEGLWYFGQVLSRAAWAEACILPGAKGGVFLVAEQGEEALLRGMGTVSRLQMWLPSWFRNISSPVNGERRFHFEAILGVPPPKKPPTLMSTVSYSWWGISRR